MATILYLINYHQTMTKSPLPVFYLGDSHVRYLKKAARIGLLSPHEVSGIEVGGATAVGMRNPNAKTNAIGRFRDWITDKPRESILIFHLGEVDCGFVVWHRAAKYSETIESQVMNSIGAYFEFVDELLSLGFRNIIITGATLPTITDDDQIGEVVIKRSSISVTQKERTDLTSLYNSFLRDEADKRGLPYVDIASDVIDPETEVVDIRMRNSNPEDHHMNGNRAAVYWAGRLRESISGFQPPVSDYREWRCTRSTYLKAYPGHSNSMAVDMRQQVLPGEIVSGNRVKVGDKYSVLRDISIGGNAFPWLSLLHTDHFELVEVAEGSLVR